MPTMTPNGASALKLLWRSVSHATHLSSTKWHTIHFVLSTDGYFVLPETLIHYLFSDNENHFIVSFTLTAQSQIWVSITIMHIDNYDDIYAFLFSLTLISKFCLYVSSLYSCWFVVVVFICGHECFMEKAVICRCLNSHIKMQKCTHAPVFVLASLPFTSWSSCGSSMQ